jgi:Holliday junction resolvase RusA-like endonuclease
MRVDRLWLPTEGVVCGVVHGALPSKANSRKLVTVGAPGNRRPLFIKSADAREYEEQFRLAVLSSNLGNTIPLGHEKLELHVVVFQESLRRDLDIELLCDVLQKSGVIVNDRRFWRKVMERRIDKANARVEFTVRALSLEGEGKRCEPTDKDSS